MKLNIKQRTYKIDLKDPMIMMFKADGFYKHDIENWYKYKESIYKLKMTNYLTTESGRKMVDS